MSNLFYFSVHRSANSKKNLGDPDSMCNYVHNFSPRDHNMVKWDQILSFLGKEVLIVTAVGWQRWLENPKIPTE